jgi:hypothetical protein
MQDILAYIELLRDRYWVIGRAHYLTAARMQSRHKWFGYPAAIISGAVGATLVTQLHYSTTTWYQTVAGLISLLGGALTTFQTFHNFAEQANRHKLAAGRYMSMRRRFEVLGMRYADANESLRKDALTELEKLNEKLDELQEKLLRFPMLIGTGLAET